MISILRGVRCYLIVILIRPFSDNDAENLFMCLLAICVLSLEKCIFRSPADIPEVTGKLGLRVQNEAGQRLTGFCQENALVIKNTLFQKHKRRLYTWASPDGQYQSQIDYILCSQRWRSTIQSAKTRPGADYGSDHELVLPNLDLN